MKVRNDTRPEDSVNSLKDAAASVLSYDRLGRLILTLEQRDMLGKIATFDVGKICGQGRMS